MSVVERHNELILDVPNVLARLLGIGRIAFTNAGETYTAHGVDLAIKDSPFRFRIEFQSNGSAMHVLSAIDRLRSIRAQNGNIPLIAVPFMGDVGRRLCENAKIGWLDLSGNADIRAKGLYIHVEGLPNRFKSPGRPANIFAPKSARIARWLLMHPEQFVSQREIAKSVDIGEGFVSRIASRLGEQRLIQRDRFGRLRVSDPNLLLDAWKEAYQFSTHRILKGHITARSGEELLKRASALLNDAGRKHAATGLGAAWCYSHFAIFRLASIYLRERPDQGILDKLGFREGVDGANVWLIIPNDAGVFHGVEVLDSVPCVHPVQAYLDLAGHPERAREAAEELRAQFLNWPVHE